MMPLSFDFFHAIRFKLMAALFVVLTVSIGTAVLGIWTYEKESFIQSIQGEAMRGGRIIEKSLRTAMLSNNRQTIQSAIDRIGEVMEPPSRVTIVGPGGKVAFSNDRSLGGFTFIRSKDPTCTVCHRKKGVPPERATILISAKAGPLLRNVIKISNHPACHRCHGADHETLGILLFDSYARKPFAMLRTVAIRTFLTGLLTFLVLIVVLTWLVSRLIHRPIQDLIKGFEEVGRGNFAHWVEVKGSDEFSEMADSFNVVSRAIGRYIGEIKLRSAETATLYSVVQRMSKTINLTELTAIVFDLLYELFEYDEIMLLLVEENRGDWFEISWRRKEETRLHHTHISLKEAELPGTTLGVEELQLWADGNLKQSVFFDHDARALLPLSYNKKRTGLICLRLPAGKAISFQRKKLVGALANHAAISFANARLYHLATTDGLTGLFTKRHFSETASRLISSEPPLAKPFWLIMIDIDHFKDINDTYGHPVGDQMLIQLADLVRANTRYMDVPCRFGGEEFVVVLPGMEGSATRVEGIAQRLRQMVENHSFTGPQGFPPIHLTISIGLASFPGHGSSMEEVIQAADSALYAAKREGRNQVRCAPAASTLNEGLERPPIRDGLKEPTHDD